MERRSFLKRGSLLATVGLVGYAGCSSPEGDGNGTTPAGGDGTTTSEPVETTSAATTTEAETTEAETTAAETTEGETTEGGTTEEGTTQTGTEDGTTTGAGGGGSETVSMVTEGSEYYFDPIGLYVEPGTTVTWSNDSGSHSSTAYAEANDAEMRIPEGAESWDSGILSEQGATFEYTFETEGTYDYFCTPHKTLGMVARIVVGEPGGPAEGSMPPDGDVPESQTIVDQGSVSYSDFSS